MHSADRVAAVRTSGLLETGPEEAFNRLTRLAAIVLGTPMVALTVVDDVRSVLKGAPDPSLLGGTYESPIEDAACRFVIDTGAEVCTPDVSLDPRLRDLRQIHDFGAASWVGVPVLDPAGRVLGNLCAMDGVVRHWTELHLETLRTLALAAGGEIALRLALQEADHHAALADLHAEQADRHATEAAELAATLQQSLLPAHPPRMDGVVVGARFRPGGTGVEVMGDFYDVVPVDGGFGVVIGDVCGKGAPAARTTAMARSALRTVAHTESDPVRVLHTLNEVLHVWFDGRASFVTALYATFTRPAGTPPGSWLVAMACAGHPPAFVRRADGSVEPLAGGGRVLGILRESVVARQTALLAAGDALVLHTDGVTEARSAVGAEQFDETGVAAALARCAPGAGADALAGALVDAANRYSGDRPTDDIGVVVVLADPRATARDRPRRSDPG
ncbi:PP2C family protein-serine/threonine phosphatase [Pseudonocardia abyssalis]|uniref:SpoIIE family protein phosphatase n=1 Tax=Pseudonocardia abyssalis TaxID=2792008 RepID=A0ABS6ULD1_9PSEU|nr:GAF domain-containing SpoIIE family protein phosphatase [Pseudonocardia abyssalis]MBW0117173.1 SpoIIE family protein phosphatase [Pseudonocardia abyssalis]MBW0133070.1 SpoIIE family protein phosphatase [Pseudonocardia abyssalis]